MSPTAIIQSATATSASALVITVTASAPPAVQVYFENSWSILSSTALLLFFAGILVMLIIGATALSIVPVVVSAGASIGNGLCYYCFYSGTMYSPHARMVAGIFADIGWGFQEIGLPFYSFFILKRILSGKERKFFMTVFWLLILGAISQRMSILVYRTMAATHPQQDFVPQVNAHHIGNFACIGAAECFSAFFLLRKFRSSRRRAAGISSTNEGLIRQLARSTEIRVAFLAFIGVGRAITYSWMVDALVAQNVPSQIDRFAVVAETMFPMILYIDLLGSKVAGMQSRHKPSYGNSGNSDGDTTQKSGSISNNRKGSGVLEKFRSPSWAGGERYPKQSQTVDSIANDFPEYSGAQSRKIQPFPAIHESNHDAV